MSEVAGVILAGGLSSRMQGKEKSLMPLAGRPLVSIVSEKLARQVSPILLNANGDPGRFDFLNMPIQADTIENYAGPLAGVLTGMRWAQTLDNIGWIITAAADTPFFPDNYVGAMLAAKADNKIILAGSNDRRHPVFGLWDISLADELESFLDNGDRKVMLFVKEYRNSMVTFPAHPHDPFFNVNTPEDWTKAEEILKEVSDHVS